MKFRDEVGAQIADAEKDAAEYRGADWWQLTDEEEAVFEIDFERFPRMITALFCFQGFHDIVDPEDAKLSAEATEAERKARPDLVEMGYSLNGFQHFARDYAGMTFREGHAVFDKNAFWQVRAGVTRYSDEQAPNED